ncbi:MAG: PLxRFG domain-containing protein [Desulfosalsimonadaceae bacterium]
MSFDILGYQKANKSYYGDAPLIDIAKDAYEQDFKDQAPDFDTWAKSSGIESHLQEDIKRRTPPSFMDKLRAGTSHVAPMIGEGQAPSRSLLDVGKDTAIDVAKGTVGLGESLVGLADIPTGNLVGKGLAKVGYDPSKTKEILSSGYSPARQLANKNVEEAKGFIDTALAYVQNPSAAIGAAIESSPGSVAISGAVRSAALKMLSAAGIKGGTAAATELLKRPEVIAKLSLISGAAEGAQSAGSIQEQGRQGSREWSDTVLPSIAAGIGTGLISVLSSKILPDVEVKAALSGMKGGAKSPIDYGKNLAKAMFKEGALEEMPQSAQEQIFSNLAMGKPWSEGVAEAAGQGLVVGALQSGGMSVTSDVIDRVGQKETPPAPPSRQMLIADLIDNGLRTGRVGDKEFSPDHAVEIIRGELKSGTYTPEDIDTFKNRYPGLSSGLNEIIAEQAMEKVSKAIETPAEPATPQKEEVGRATSPGKPLPSIETDVPESVASPLPEEGLSEPDQTRAVEILSKPPSKWTPEDADFVKSIGGVMGLKKLPKDVRNGAPLVSASAATAQELTPGQPPAVAPEVKQALQKPTPIPTSEAVKTKAQTKETLTAKLGTGEIVGNSPVRLTTVDELRSIIKKGALSMGEDAEGVPGISAQRISKEIPIVAYGANNKISAAIVFPDGAVESTGNGPNEVKIRPNTKIEDLRFVIDGHEELLSYNDIKNLYAEKGGISNGQVQAEAEIEASSVPAPAPIVQPAPSSQAVPAVQETPKPQSGTKTFIDNKIRELGTVEAVNKFYSGKDAVSDYARTMAPKILGMAAPVTTQVETPEAKTKEPWEYTRDEWAKGGKGQNFEPGSRPYKTAANGHAEFVKRAFFEGKPVPPAVLAEYPDLKPAPAATPEPVVHGEKKGKTLAELGYKEGEIKSSDAVLKIVQDQIPADEFRKRLEALKAKEKQVSTKTPREYGRDAFKRGLKAVPILDKEFWGEDGSKKNADLEEWSKGWHEANMAAPVEGVPGLPSAKLVASEPVVSQGKKPKPAKSPYGRAGAAAFKKIADRANLTADMGGDYRDLVTYFEKHYNRGLEGKPSITDIHPDDARASYEAGKKDREAKAVKPNLLETGPPPGGWTEADKVPQKYRKGNPLVGLYEGDKNEASENPKAAEIAFRKDLNRFSGELQSLLKYQPDVTTKGTGRKAAKNTTVSINIAPVGGDGHIILWKPNSEFGIYISVPVHRGEGDGLTVGGMGLPGGDIMFRATSKANKFTGYNNQWAPAAITPEELARRAQAEVDFHEQAAAQKIIKEAQDAGIKDAAIAKALAEGEKAGETEGTFTKPEQVKEKIEELSKELGVNIGFAPEIKVQGEWSRNGLVFATEQEAADWGVDRMQRWMMAEDSRAVPVAQAPGWTWKDGELKEIKASAPEVKAQYVPGSLKELPAVDLTPAPYGSTNKLFTEDKANAARERLRKKLAGIHMGVPLDAEMVQDGINLAGYHIEAGARTFNAYAKKMIADLGEAIRPYLKSFYMAVRNYPGFDKTDMNTEADLDAIDNGIVTLEDKKALMGMLERDDTVFYTKYNEKRIASGYFRRHNDGGYITVVSGGGLSTDVFPDDIIRAERAGKPIDIAQEKPIIESKEGGVENVNAPDQEPARRDVVGGTPRLDAGELSGEGPRDVQGENAEEVPGREGRPGTDEVGGTGEEGNAGGTGGRSDTGEPDITTERPGPERQPAETASAGAAPQNQEVVRGKVPKRDDGSANHRIAPEDTIFHSGKTSRINANIRAIQLLKKLEEKDRQATPAEKKILAEFTGWGAVAEDVFKLKYDEYVRDYHGKMRTTRGYYRKTEERPYQPSDKFYGDDLQKYETWKEKYGDKLHPGLGGILTEDEWKAAQESALNAHYTDRPVIEAMWAIARRLGFEGGKVLEPGAGVGHFFGLIPEDIAAKSKLSGVELDPITGRILTKLYPEADIQVTGFENAKRINDNTFDLVISNFPFGNYPVSDKTHPAYSGWSVHNYFFARSLDAVKPGGLVLSVTSHYSMDTTKDGKIREYLAGKADLVGAIRLPGTAFEKNAGTSVTTDILIFRKKTGTEYPNPQNWRLVVPVDATEGGKVNVNEYFANNPAMVLGKHSTSGSMHAGKKEYTLLPNKNVPLGIQIIGAAMDLPENIMEQQGTSSAPEKETIAADKNAKEGTFTIHDGKIGSIKNGAIVPVSFAKDPKKMAQAVSYVGIRDSRKSLIDLMQSEGSTDEEISAAQEKLSKAYDAYVKKYGEFHKRASAFLDECDEFPTVLSLETVSSHYVAGIKLPIRTYIKDDIFTTRTVFPFIEPKTAENAADALRLSVTYRNGVDLNYVGTLLNIAPEEAKTRLIDEGIAFVNPTTGQVESKEEYLSGNVREKLKQAEAADLKKNVEALTKVLPEDKVIDEIHYKIGSEWIPPSMIDNFIQEVMGVEVTTSRTNIELSNDAASSWSIQKPDNFDRYNRDTAVWTQWGYVDNSGGDSISGVEMIEESLNLRRVEVFDHYEDENGNEKRTKNNEKTLVAQQKQKEIMGYWEGDRLVPGAFRDWVMTKPEHISTIEKLFNEKANNFVVRQYEVPAFEHFPNASHAIKLYPHQKRAVMRGLVDSGVIYAHAVGTGKTYMYSTLAMELKRIKRARKPMIVVQGSTLKQFAAQAHKLYPTAKILALAKEEISGAQNRQAMMAKVANGDWDMVIIAHSTFNRISMDPVRETAFIEEQLAEIEAAIRSEGGDPNKSEPRKDSLTVKELRKLLKRKRERLEKLAARSQDNAVTFEGLGVDALLVDEAHTYKRGDFFTKMGNIKGLDRGAAQKSFDFMMKTRYVQEKTGGKNVYLATGTPVSNTIAEVWTLLRYSRPDLLKEYGVSQFDGFASMFGDTRVSLEPTETGEYKMIERFNKYSNGVQLINMWLSGADVILQEDVPGWAEMVPKLKGGEFTKVSLPRPKSLDAFIEDIRRRKKEWEDLPGREKMNQRHVPIVLYGEAKKGSIDLRLVHPNNPDDPGNKVNHAVQIAFKKWQGTKDEKGTQLIFSDLFQSPDPGAKKLIDKENPKLGKKLVNPELSGIPRFNLFEDIKKKLVNLGVPAEEIAIINDPKYSSDTNKEKLFEKVNDGAIRILMGSTEKLGIGVNVQERLAHVIHMDAPARPMDFEQRNGRILRPGNGFKEVEVTLLAIVNSMDEVTYTRLQKKQKFTNQLLRGNIPGNTFEDPSDEVQNTLEDMIAIASGNPLTKRRYELENNIRELETLKTGHAKKIGNLRHSKTDVENKINRRSDDLVTAERRVKELTENYAGKFNLKIKDKSYEDEKAGTEALADYADITREAIEKEYAEKYAEEKKQAAEFLKEGVKDKKGRPVSLDWTKSYRVLGDIEKKFSVKLNGATLYIKAKPNLPTNWSWSDEERLAALEEANVELSYSYGEYVSESYHSYRTVKGLLANLHKKIGELFEEPGSLKEDIVKEKKNLKDINEELTKPFPHTQRLEDLRKEYEDVLSQIGTKAGEEVGDAELSKDEAQVMAEESAQQAEAEKANKYYVHIQQRQGPATYEEVKGYPVANDYGLEMFAYKRDTDALWVVTDRITGRRFGTGNTRIEAINNTLNAIENNGIDETIKIINTAAEKGISPWAEATGKRSYGAQEETKEVPKGDQYTATPEPSPVSVTLPDVQKLWPKQEVIQPGGENSPVYIKTRGGKYITIETVNYISPNEVEFRFSHGEKFDPKTMTITGAYGDGVIRLVRNKAGIWTAAHESFHAWRKMGLINDADADVLKAHIKRLVYFGRREVANREDIGGEEDQANFMADAVTKPTPSGAVGKIVARIKEWIDRLINYAGIRTAGGIVRDVTSGRIFNRGLTETQGTGTNYAVTSKKGTANIPPETTPKAVGGIKETLLDALQNKAKGEEIGLRIPSSPSAIYSREYAEKKGLPWSEEIKHKEGDILDPSYKWVDDEPTNKKYAGTSVVHVTLDNIEKAIKIAQKYPNAEQVLIVKGKRIGKAGNDPGEVFLSNPEVVSVHKFSDLPNPSRPPEVGGRVHYSVQKAPPQSKDPKVLNLYLKDETDAIVQTIINKLHPESMSWMETMLKSPEWFDHPQVKNIVRFFMRDRSEIYHETFNDLNKADNPFQEYDTVTEAAKALKNKGLTMAERVSGKVSSEYERLGAILDEGDTTWKRDTKKPLEDQIKAFEDHIREQGATEDTIAVWKLYRESYDKALDLQTKQLKDMIDQVTEEARWKGQTPDLEKLKQTLKGALAQMEEWKGFYAPRVREQGDWKVQAFRTHGPMNVNKEFYREHAGSELAARRVANKLQREGWTISNVGKVEKVPEEIYQDVNAVATAKLIDAALDKMGDKGDLSGDLTAKFNEEILRAVADEIRARGFRGHMIHRSGSVIRGFIEDPLKRHLLYINQLSGGISKARVARMAMEELLGQKIMGKQEGGIDPVKDPKAYEVATNYIREQLRNMDSSDRMIGLAKSIATFKFLGFSVRSLAVNMTAVMTTAPAAIHQYAMGGKGSMMGILREIGIAGKDYGALMAGKKLSNSDEQRFMDDAHKKGSDDAQYTREALGEISKVHSKIWSSMMDGSMYLFGKSEKWNRGATLLAAYRVARKTGIDHISAMERAKNASDKAHGVYGRSTMPMWAQGANPAARLGQMMYVYSKFGHNYLQMLYDMGLKKHNIKGAMFAFLSPLVLAGGAALPFKGAIFGFAGVILKSLFGDDRDPEKWVWDTIREHLGKRAEKIGRHGLTGAAGLDISGSLSIGVGIPKNFIDLTGAIGGVATEGKEAWDSLMEGRPGKAAEHLLPAGFANPLRAMREAKEGSTTRKNRRVWDENGRPFIPSGRETAARVFGFRSTNQAVLSERTFEGHELQAAFAEKRNTIYERFRAWEVSGRDRQEYRKIIKAVQEYNASIAKQGAKGVSRITSQSLRDQARRMRRPSKNERALLSD